MSIPELGHFALILAFVLALVQGILPFVGVAVRSEALMGLARHCARGQFCLVLASFLALVYAFYSNDFSVAYVATNSSSSLPTFYRLTAVWGAHEGSLLLWLLILAGWTTMVSIFSKSLPLETVARVLGVMGLISVGLYLFILATSNPFLRLLPNFPIQGQDLNPLLQDPGFVIHPPMLYMGYVGFSVAFAFAIAALLSGRLDQRWVQWVRPWTLVAWIFLTFGITLGSWWAYRELGWGGWWFWDPVENASFMPWLVGTALVHCLSVSGKRDGFKGWTVLLALSAFSLSLLGTFLVRSGVLNSVHAFALDPTRGAYLLVFLAVVVGSSLSLYTWRASAISTRVEFSLFSRETLLLLNNVLLAVACATVLLGTLYPLLVDALGFGKLSVGPPYFNTMFVPLMVLVMISMGMGPLIRWRQDSLSSAGKRFVLALIVCTWIAFGVAGLFYHLDWQMIVGIALSLWVVQAVIIPRSQSVKSWAYWGMLFAHVGFAVTAYGIVATSHLSTEREVRATPGQQFDLGPYQFTFVGTTALNGANYTGAKGEVRVSRDGHLVAILRPEKRKYTVTKMVMTDSDIDAGFTRDLYTALGEPLAGNAWALRLYYKPFVRWIWLGGLLMMLGGSCALFDRRYRVRKHPQKEAL